MTDFFDLLRAPPPLPRPPEYDVTHIPPGVVDLFERLTYQLINMGRKHYSSDAILHRIRWHFDVEKGDEDFKCNNNWTAELARWFMDIHPEHDGFFELRVRAREREAD
jgi:hypothetical protein